MLAETISAALEAVAPTTRKPGTDMAELVIAAATVLLGARGLAVHAQDVERIVQDGRARQRQTI
jgi:hypothetical protein